MTLEERVLRLERQARRWKYIAGGALVLLVAFVTMAQAKPGEKTSDDVTVVKRMLVTEGITIGEKYAEDPLKLLEAGGGTLATREHLNMVHQGSFVTLTSAASCGAELLLMGESIVSMETGGEPNLSIHDKTGTLRMKEGLDKEGCPFVKLGDAARPRGSSGSPRSSARPRSRSGAPRSA